MGSTPRTSFRLSSETLATLDARRGTTSRSEFVRRLIADAATSPPRFVPVESIDVVPHVVDVEPRFKAKGRGS